MFTVESVKKLSPLSLALAALLVLLPLAGPALSLAHTAPSLGVVPDSRADPDQLGLFPFEIARPQSSVSASGGGSVDASAISLGVSDLGRVGGERRVRAISLQQGPVPSVQFDAAAYSVGEGTGPALITVTLSAAYGVTVTVGYTTSAGTATAGSDYTDTVGTLTFTPGDERKLITVPIGDDPFDEPDAETIGLTLSDPISATLGTPYAATLSIVDNDAPPTVQFSDSTYGVAEDGGTAAITVTLSLTSERPIQVDYAATDGTANVGSDYTDTSGTLAFAPGDASKLITVPITDDLLYEANETINLTLSNASNATPGTFITATLSITDDDPMPTVQFQTTSYGVDEAVSPATTTVTLSAVSGVTISVGYVRDGGTATAGDDYVLRGNSLVFAPGQVSRTLTVAIVDDVFDEDDETLGLELRDPVNAALGAFITATLTITDDDDPPTVQFDAASYSVDESAGLAVITVTLDVPSSRIVTVNYATGDGTATAGSDYTTTTGSLTFTPPTDITVQATLERRTNTSGYSPPSPDPVGLTYVSSLDMLLISDSEVEEMVNRWEGVNLFGAALSGTLIYTSSTMGFSQEPEGVAYNPDNQHLFFTDDDARRVFELNPGTDGLYGTADDVVTSTLTSDFGCNKPLGVAYDSWRGHLFVSDWEGNAVYEVAPGANGIFDGVPASSPPGDDQVTRFDTYRLNGGAPEDVAFNPDTGRLYILGTSSALIAETTTDGKLVRYIDISSLTTVLPAGLAYAPSSTNLAERHLYIVDRGVDNNDDPDENDGVLYEISFPPGEITRTFAVPIIDDILAEGSETVNLALSDPVNATLDPSGDSATLTIVDRLPSVQFGAASFVVDEGSGSALVTATLSIASELTVTVDYAASDGTAKAGDDYVAASGTLTFPAGTVTQTFSVTIIDDALDELDEETVNLALGNPSNAELGALAAAVLRIQDDDPLPTVGFSPPTFVQVENGVTALVGVELSEQSALTVTVDYVTGDGTGTAGSDYVTATGTLTFNPGTTARSFSVSILNDGLDEENETVNLTLSNASNAALALSATTLTILDDDDPPTVQFDAASHSVDESAGSATITVTLSAESERTVTVDYATSDGTATAGSDYLASTGTLTFTPGTTAQSFSVSILSDGLDEANETVNLTLSNASNAGLGTSASTLTILDDDDPPTVQFDSSSYSVAEDGGTATITVTLSAESGRSVAVDYATSDGTATEGSDYTDANGTLVFAAGQTTRTFSVTISDDNVDEADETVNLALSNASNATLGTPSTATLTISDNDQQPSVEFGAASYSAGEGSGQASITATLSHPSAFTVSVAYATSDGTALAGDDYQTAAGTLTYAPGQTEQSFAVTLVADTVDEWDETVGLALSAPVVSATLGARYTATLTILDDDDPPTVQFGASSYSVDEDAGSATVTLTLSVVSGKQVTVDYATSDGTAQAGADYLTAAGTLTFAAGVTEQAFSVTISDDGLAETDETVDLALGNPSQATPGTPYTATLTIEDNEGLPAVQFDSSSSSVDESAGSATITATLSHASVFTVTVGYATGGGTASAGVDYVAANGTLTFPAGELVQTFSVTILGDNLDEWNETVNLALSAPVSAMLGTPTAATLTILDDDDPPTVQFDSPVYLELEGNTSHTIWVILSAVSGRTVTVDYATSDGTATAGSDYLASTGTLTFTPGTTAQSFSVSILSDGLDEANETVNLTLSNASNAGLGTSASTLTILDDDDPPTVQFDSSSYSVAEDGGTATITVTLSAESGRSVAVDYATSDGTATEGSDYTDANGTLVFAAGQTTRTFSVTISDDNVDEADETVNLALSNASNATLGTPSTATLTISDNDQQPSVEFGAASYSAGEGSGQASITATLSHPSAFTVSVAYATSDGTALAGDDYQTAAGTLTYAPGQTEQSFAVTLVADTVDEWDETVGLALSAPVVSATLGARYTATLTILDDDDPPTVQFDTSSYSVVESAGSVTVTVTLSAVSIMPVTVDYATSDGTAQAGADYLTAAGTLTFAAGVTEQAFSVTIIDDELDEENETVDLTLSNPSGATLGTSSTARLTIVQGTFNIYLPVILRIQ